jgi:hypothetical protein
MFVVKGFTGIHMKLDHILIVATDGYLERGTAPAAEAEAANRTWQVGFLLFYQDPMRLQ